MTIGAARYGTRADTVAFVACLVLALVALALPSALREPIAGALRQTILAPVIAVESRAAAVRARHENLAALRAQRDSLALAAQLLPALQAENAQLRALLGLRGRLRVGFVTAEVLHQPGPADGVSLLLSAGRAEGVEPLTAVVAPAGLVGMVTSTDPHSSVAMAWTHPEFRASAMAVGGAVVGIVAARSSESGTRVMALQGVPYRTQLPPGTPVVTSGLGGVFPRGIPLGTVVGVLSESAGWERTYLLKPAVHPAQASHVLILSRTSAAESLGAAFDSTVAPAVAHGRRVPRAGRPGEPQ